MSEAPSPDELSGQNLHIEWVHQALELIYSNAELAGCALASRLPEVSAVADVVGRAQTLRNILIGAIEGLRPPRPTPPHILAARSYQVLSLRYISGLQIYQIAERLAIGERQVYRDLRRAEGELALVLRSRLAQDGGATQESCEPGQAAAPALQPVNLPDLLQRAMATVSALAAARRVELCRSATPAPVRVLAVPGILCQVLVQILSASIQSSPPGQTLTVALYLQGDHAVIAIGLPGHEPLAREQLLESALAMAGTLGIETELRRSGKDIPCVVLRLPVARPRTVLIVEDNRGVADLYQRYLQGTDWLPVLTADPRQAHDLAVAHDPSAIVLDILMPEREGWSVLQALQVDPRTAHIPVVVCSVINDPELASALGAAASLKKPVARLELLQALATAVRSHNGA